jgi:hypothetical protein
MSQLHVQSWAVTAADRRVPTRHHPNRFTWLYLAANLHIQSIEPS